MTHISHVFFICEKSMWTNWTINWITPCWLHDLFHWFRIHPPKTKEWRAPKWWALVEKVPLLYENMAIFCYQFLRFLGCLSPMMFVCISIDGRQVHSLTTWSRGNHPEYHGHGTSLFGTSSRSSGGPQRPTGFWKGHVGWLVFADPKNEQTLWGDVCVRWTWGNRTWCRVVPFGTKFWAQIFFLFCFLLVVP